MDFLEIAKLRYSCRKYKDKKVEDEKLQKILEAARVAPTGCNNQPQKFIIVRSKEGLEKINKGTKTFGAPLAIIVCSDVDKEWTRPYDGKKLTDIDAAILTDHMMLQATELGLNSVWVCYFKPDIIRQEFDIPDNLEIINILMIGYGEGESESMDRHQYKRNPINELILKEV